MLTKVDSPRNTGPKIHWIAVKRISANPMCVTEDIRMRRCDVLRPLGDRTVRRVSFPCPVEIWVVRLTFRGVQSGNSSVVIFT